MPSLIFDMTMNDGSRHFYGHPILFSWNVLMEHLETLGDLKITNVVTDHLTEAWVDFTFRDHKFSINDQNGDFWFFSEDRDCPEEVLLAIAEHCSKLPQEKA